MRTPIAPIAYTPPPADLPVFPQAKRTKSKTSFPGGLRARWKGGDRIYEWDYEKGRVEAYTRNGTHVGEFDHITGKQTGEAIPGRKVEP